MKNLNILFKPKFFYSKVYNNFASYNKKRMVYNHLDLRRDKKILEDLLNMREISDFKHLAASNQSDFYYNTLFELLREDIKSEKQLEKKIQNMKGKTDLNVEEMNQMFQEKFREYLTEGVEHLKETIREKAKTNPDILKADPEWMEKMKSPEGIEEYLYEKQVDFSDETFLTHPELNQLLLRSRPEEYYMSFADLYFHGFINEDEMRLDPHVSSMKSYSVRYMEDIESTGTINNDMWQARLKKDTESYIDTVLSKEFQEYSLSYAKTEDNYRVDVGLIISRPPIFLSVYPDDMEFGKYRRNIFKKYYMDQTKYNEELENFNEVQSEYWEVMKTQFKGNKDNIPNLRKWNKEKGEYDLFAYNSKHFLLADPNVQDDKCIQYEGTNRVYFVFKNKHTDQWEFPSLPLINGDSFEQVKYKLFLLLSKEKFKVFYPGHTPILHLTRNFHEYEREDPKNKGLQGVKTFYYEAYHFRAGCNLFKNKRHPYVDFALCPKYKINQKLSRNYWNEVIGSLEEI